MKMEAEKISVIVPCYNVAEWLPRCLDSIINQTYNNLEIILINDGSTDETANIIDTYATQDSRIVVIHQKNEGLVAVREKGIELATGDYIGFVDSDDSIEADMYERLINNALKYNADISHCGVSFVWSNSKTEQHYGTGRIIEQTTFEGIRDLLSGEYIEPSLCNKLYTKKLLCNSCPDKTILNNEDLLRNFVLFGRAEKSVYEDFCGYNYYQRSGSMSKNQSKTVSSFRHIEKARRLIVEKSDEKTYPYAMQLWLSTYISFINQNYKKSDTEINNLYYECRRVLFERRKDLVYLTHRQQIAARLAIYAPWLHHIVYKIYNSRR